MRAPGRSGRRRRITVFPATLLGSDCLEDLPAGAAIDMVLVLPHRSGKLYDVLLDVAARYRARGRAVRLQAFPQGA
ncbi:MAG: hypothetical protein HYX53_17560 [Chloroflexi bacterium]|nr:hypothetical protein [Chloroflexota bacterium]